MQSKLKVACKVLTGQPETDLCWQEVFAKKKRKEGEGKFGGEVIEEQEEGKEEQKKEERKMGGRCKLQCKKTKRGRESYFDKCSNFRRKTWEI